MQERTDSDAGGADEHFDVLIIGAGSAGSAVAARVSENPNWSVALVEAGPDYPRQDELPFDLHNAHNNSYRDHDWGFNYEPTTARQDRFPRGRVVGGSSAVNTAIALRGMPEDYDEWAAAGNNGWSWSDVLPVFKRLERDLDFPDADYHGDSGPITIRRHPTHELLPQHQAFLQTADDLGYAYCEDANDPAGWGAGPQPMNKLGRLRVSAAVGYLAAARARPNLEILPHMELARLLFDGTRCIGGEFYQRDEALRRLQARLVIVCGGAIGSPCMLLRSGVGAPDAVARLGVDSVAKLPGVGENLSDHPALAVVCEVKDPSLINFDAPIIQTILRYTANGSDKRNDLQIEQLSFAGRPGGAPTFAIAAVLEYQYGRGRLTLSSARRGAQPTIDNRFCEDERDCDRLAGCLQDTLAFTRSGALADMISQVRFPDPGRGTSLDDLRALCRKFSGSGYHPSGTVKMGPLQDGGVVDAMGRVHETEQLVVADASIMPFVPRANTNLTCFMIGEQIGEWVRTRAAEYGL